MRPTILFIAHRFPFPPDKGERIRSYHQVRYLAEYADIDLIGLADEPVTQQAVQEMARYCRTISMFPSNRRWCFFKSMVGALLGKSFSEGYFFSLRAWLTIKRLHRQNHYSAMMGCSSSTAPYLLNRNSLRILDLVDVDSQKWLHLARQTPFPRSLVYFFEAGRVARLEQKILHKANHVLLTTQAEVKLLDTSLAKAAVHVIKNGVDFEKFSPPTLNEPKKNQAVFVGVMDYGPNEDAMVWFCLEVWPFIVKLHPQAHFCIVGRNPTRRVQALASESIEVTGAVADVRPYVQQSRFALLPFRVARGIQNKALEAMSMGLPLIVAPALLPTLPEQGSGAVLTYHSPEELIAQSVRLFEDHELCATMGQQGRALILQHCDWRSEVAKIAALLAPLTQPGAPPADSKAL
jgi:sugar transferase (PEP-CTERM/EpsH1 system associated)